MKNRLTKNGGLKIMAILFAILLWIIVVNIDDPVSSMVFRNVEVTIQHEEIVTNRGKTYQVIDNTQTVAVTVRAKRSVLDKIRTSDIVAVADMKEMELKTLVPIRVSITGFEGDYEEATANPRNVQVKIEDSQSNKFPITAVTTGSLRDGFVLGEIKAIPETITIDGPESLVSRVDKVVAKVDISGLSSDTTLQGELVIYDVDGNVIDQTLLGDNLGDNKVAVSITLLHTKSVGLTFSTSGDPAEGYTYIEMKYEPQELLVAGTEAALAEIESIIVPSSALDITDISQKTEIVVDMTKYLPDGITLVDSNANNVIVTISVERIGTKAIELPVGSITVNNLATDLKLSFGNNENITLEFEGTTEALDSLTIKKVEASIDLKELKTEGAYDVPLLVQAPNATAVGNVIVNVILKKQ
ncbi:MAG: CdaR family protein [Lachnospiraceae bacterium]|nr:CdaR family protein [Lachnospiraceae bacterium]